MEKDLEQMFEEFDEENDANDQDETQTDGASLHDPKPSKSSWQDKVCLTQITLDILDGVIKEIQEDQCLPDEMKNLLSSDPGLRESLMKGLEFLNDCLVQPSKFPNTSAEKAWSKFHSACEEHIPAFSKFVTLPVDICFHVALVLFGKLIHINYLTVRQSVSPQTTPETVSEAERDILHYIGGFIVRKIEDKLGRIKRKQNSYLQLLQAFKTEKGQSTENPETLTAIHDRGGLTYVTASATTLLAHIEHIFRSTVSPQQCNMKGFVEHCMGESYVTTTFFDMTYHCDAEDHDRSYILEEILALFFRVRMYHKCKKMMDDHRSKKSISRKQKGLRKELKQSSAETSLKSIKD